MSTADPTAIDTTAAEAGARASVATSVLRNSLGLAAVIVLAAIILLSLLGPTVAPHDPNQVRIDLINTSPGGEYLLGGDGAGRDILSRLLWGAGNTLVGALIAVGIAMLLGTVSGLLAGYFGGFFDGISSWVANILLALPAMIILLSLYQVLKGSVYASMAVFGVLLAPGFFRLVRNLVIAVKGELYVDAARVSGLTNGRIISRHVLGVIRSPIIIQTAIVAGLAIIIQSGLAFLGLGDSSTPSWGESLANAFSNIYVAPTSIIWPGVLIGLTVSALVLFGNAIRDGLQGARVAGTPRATRPTHASAPSDDAEGALLSIRDLHVAYGAGNSPKEVVNGVSLSLRPGEILGIVGESGSGKTQTAFSVLGLLPRGGRVTKGSIRFEDRELTTMSGKEVAALRGRSIAYIPQEPMSNLDPSFTIGFQLVEPMRAVLGISKSEARARALELLARVGIPDPERTYGSYPHEVSGGMAQRALIASAVSCRPSLLIADEPTTALDVTVQAEILELLRELQAEMRMGIILVTHNFGVVADICERVVVMQNGTVVETNDVEALFDHPQDPYTQMLLNSTLDDAAPRGPLATVGGE
jgi:peptide/nickel transport system permease protein